MLYSALGYPCCCTIVLWGMKINTVEVESIYNQTLEIMPDVAYWRISQKL